MYTPGLEFLAGSAAAGEQVVAQQTKPLPQAVGLSHGVGMLHQLRVQLLQVQQWLLLHLSQQPQGLLRHLDRHTGHSRGCQHAEAVCVRVVAYCI